MGGGSGAVAVAVGELDWVELSHAAIIPAVARQKRVRCERFMGFERDWISSIVAYVFTYLERPK